MGTDDKYSGMEMGVAKFGLDVAKEVLGINYLIDESKKFDNFNFINIDMKAGNINPYTGLPTVIQKKDVDQGWSDVDDYALGISQNAMFFLPQAKLSEWFGREAVRTYNPDVLTTTSGQERDIFRALRKPDAYREEKPFGKLIWSSQ